VYLDGRYLSTQELVAPEGTYGTVRAYTPCVPAGTHTVRLFWNNTLSRLRLRLHSLEAFALGGPDADADGFADWIGTAVRNGNGVDAAPAAPHVSPACVEGPARYPWTVEAAASSPTGAVALAVRQGAGDRWFCDVPLSPDAPTPLALSFEAGARAVATNLVWTPLNPFAPDVPSVTLRAGDALLVGGLPPGATNGPVAVAVGGVTNWTAEAGAPAAVAFTAPGEYWVEAVWTDGEGNAVAAEPLAVTVVSASFPAVPAACLLGVARTWDCPELPDGVRVESDARVAVSRPAPGRLSLRVSDTREDHVLVARTHAGGPILDAVRLDPFWVQAAADGEFWIIERYESSQLWECPIVTMNVPPTVDILLKVYVGGVVFDDFTVERWIALADLDAAGEYKLRLIHPNSVTSSACHTVKLYQDGALVGEAYYSGMQLPDELR
jgi:hypothetical protein